MSGEFNSIYEESPGKLIGRTHGCSCCSDEVEITVENLQEHIDRLEVDLERARKILFRLQTQQPLLNGID